MQEPPRSAAELRRWVRARSPQPFEDADVQAPPTGRAWAYGPGQYELALLNRLVDEGFAANRHVHYPRNHGRVAGSTVFTAAASASGSVELRISGRLEGLTVGGDPVTLEPSTEPTADPTSYRLRLPAPGAAIRIHVVAGADGGVPAVSVPSDAPLTRWLAGCDGAPLEEIRLRSGGGSPPHEHAVGTVELRVRPGADGLYDLGAPVLGRPVIESGSPPVVSTGESVEEALAGPDHHETRHEVVRRADGTWTTRHPLGFRYLSIRGVDPLPAAVRIEASIATVPSPGAFACSDDRLTRIWATAQYTLRLCSQGLMIDGIKRDRMPWAGDQALSTLANAYALGDGGTVADGLVALGRPEHGYVNGIADYSLWWVVNAGLRLRWFGDAAFAAGEADRLDRFVADLATHAGLDGVFRPTSQRGGFPDAGPGSVFLDWGLRLEHGRDSVALQMLWLWALRSAERVLREVGHAGAERWAAVADTLAASLRRRAWLADHDRWADYLDARRSERPARYANFLAVLCGIHEEAPVPAGVVDALRDDPGGTPFMTAFRLLALTEAGLPEAAVAGVRDIWGPMVDAGPGTFWEEAKADGDVLEMYGRPFGRSRCHGWASGPAALLPAAILGIRPVADGWSRFEVAPALGGLDWAGAVVPTAGGDLVVSATATDVRVEIPAGSVLVRGAREVPGPARVEWSTPAVGGGDLDDAAEIA
ncbi:family 78 glycoside hydrolase catalytic domain [Agromyces sp. LHK192]|uniref:alpha-L-rhamnosidase-related protein n=1 Tax=Agromyces sp. LHK192 TaxID=2498704 RepID=UPI000FDA3171|nr:family 78 glycoside hydrolase catalytic domain [Agromyces sp. LHK192]